MAELRRILFVDNENTVLRELETGLAAMRGQWQMEFISDARAALQRLDEERFDALIADPCLSGKDGASLLAEAAQRHPPLVRIVLAGPSERSAALDALAVAHQVLAKPCDPAELRATIGRALALRKFLGGDTPLKALVSRLDSLPSMPALYRRIVEELQSAHASFESVAAIIGQDPPMAAKILQLVNSAYFTRAQHVSDLSQALRMLGLDTIKALVLSLQVFSQFDAETLAGLSVERIWRHSVRTGALARAIARAERAPREVENDAFTAALLHDVGKLILAANLPNIYAKIGPLCDAEALDPCAAERRLFGAAHAETGAYLLGLWGLPESIVEAVAYHHHPRDREPAGICALTWVHAANALAQLPDAPVGVLDAEYLGALDLLERLPAWAALGEAMPD